ncbi:EamA family transporter RarD [Staphylococcus carnosus]|uniref:Membrane protein n=1 Tax=Staphylococcus carnosus (strain TM300) TaxID=396513 RepID=B9DNY6_STACT|nr:EamA family transporter RarD [Staphylococcus carnosus]ANZ33359.1 chloramphenicol-sensitivity protein RarD [Staphylococcus carnosus]KOR13651.1 chloramphenicol-sensitive protein RarD [Staphylococcus carnosus]QPT04120.1 EamA family transporter RarD [Staphylococcus carnosus]UQA66845.1 EamA family transporter RarD [Staphylococcus carnosus]UTB78320.1 chloramphenicol-sensitivity protein RarD [Staphylococcus carnosus]
MNQEFKRGILYSLIAYILWGTLPIYWSLLNDIGPFEILAYRIILSMIFMVVLIYAMGKYTQFINNIKLLTMKQLIALTAAGYIITINWGTFIWAVNNNHVLQSSLGYYINPLVSIILAMIFLKERFTKMEWLAIIFAVIGVLYMTIKIGEFPIVSIMLALSFGFYGLLKKIVPIDALSSITYECIVTTPAALIYIIYLWTTHQTTVGFNMPTFWLLFSGAITAIPLISFSAGARRIPLSLMGFIQYVGPTLMFILGIFVYKEAFDINQLITFIFIWAGIIVYCISQYVQMKKDKNPAT